MEEPALGAELGRTPIGSDMALAFGDPEPAGLRWFLFGAKAGESVTQSSTLSAGTYIIDCVTFTSDVPDHLWRPAMIEVVAP